jgi:uncharacterized protein (DUF1501 family)
MALTRRELLFRSFGAFGAAALAFERFGLLNAHAQGEYRALVCIFLNGGNDADNVVVPFDDYDTYATVRMGTGLQLPKFDQDVNTPGLLPVNVPSIGSQFGFHPRITGLHQLYTQGQLAVVCNVGNLVEPTTRATYQSGAARRPRSLFSHSDQVNEWQAGVSPDSFSSTGWCGRTADRVAGPATFPVGVTITGNAVLLTGALQRPLAVSPAPTRVDQVLRIDGFQNPPENDPRYQAMRALLEVDNELTIVRGASGVTNKALDIEASLRAAGDPAVPPFPLNPRTSLGNQLEQVAKLISLRGYLGMNRQIFLCSLGGFDTHNGQVAGNNPTQGTHANLWVQVSNAMKTFYDATVQLGVASQVVTFTISDFARTFKPNSGLGTDHAWGGHHFVMGGSVVGGDFYGVPGPNATVFPTLVPNGPDDSDSGSGARGRWVPTTSVDQYGGTLVKWLGIGDADLPGVFPNVGRFAPSVLGFLPTSS